MTRLDRKQAAQIILDVADGLAGLLLEIEGEPIDPSLFEIELIDDPERRGAYVRADTGEPSRAIIEINPLFVADLHAAIDTFMRIGFPADEASAGDAPSETGAVDEAAFERDNAERTRMTVEVALQWVFLHEIAHWRLGHVGYAARVSGRPIGDLRLSAIEHEFALDAVTTRPVMPDTDYRCIELQADFEATQLLDIIHAEDADSGEVDAPPTAMTASRQLIAVAVGAVILLIQSLREKKGVACSRHPLPEARAHNMMQVLMARSVAELGYVRDGELRLPTGDDERVDRIRKTWADALPVFYRFLTPLADQLGVEPIFSRPDLVPASDDLPPDQTAPSSARDLMLFVLDAAAGPERFSTEGCRELARLRKANRDLMAALAPFANGPQV